MESLITHTIEPVYDGNSRILILGTMPSPKSRETGFYYGHPQNRFWPILSAVFDTEPVPVTPAQRKSFALSHRLALWDVLASCLIQGADDHSIRDPVPNDLTLILKQADIQFIFTTGRKASELYRQLCQPQTGRPSHYLPSTSAANRARYPDAALVQAYTVIRDISRHEEISGLEHEICCL